MYATERHALILERIAQHGKVTVRELAGDLDVTPETIRRDLDQLELESLVRRVHGGAVSSALGSLAETAVATIVSFVVGYAVIAFLMRWLQTRSFLPFVIYRLLLGGTLMVLLATNVLQPY